MKQRLLVVVVAVLSVFIASTRVSAQNVLGTQYISAADTSCATANVCALYTAIPNFSPAIAFTISGTFVGTVQFEVTSDGTNWASVAALPSVGGATVTSATAVGTWSISNFGYLGVRVRGSAWTSGVAIVVATTGPISVSSTVSLTDLTLTGHLFAADGSAVAPSISFTNSAQNGFYLRGANDWAAANNGVDLARFTFGGVTLGTTANLGWGSVGVTGADLFLARDSAATLAQRNGVNAQAFRVYSSFTDASNYGRVTLNAGAASLLYEAAGTGPTTSFAIGTATANSLFLQAGGTNRWSIASGGSLLAVADNTYDIGASGATRPRNVFVAGNISAGSLSTTGSVFPGTGGTKLTSGAVDGNLTIWNAAGTDFGLLQLGGTTSSFPALKRTSAAIEVKVADDSAYATLNALNLGYTLGVKNAATGSLLIFGAAPSAPSSCGTTPTIAVSNGTASFLVNGGTGGAATGCTVTMPAATTGWNCNVDNRTSIAAHRADRATLQTATTTTSVTFEYQIVSTGAATPFTASDVFALVCFAY